MISLWSAAFLLLNVYNGERQPWIAPMPGVRLERTRPMRGEQDLGPDSAYRLLLQAGDLPPEADFGWIRDRILERFASHPWPTQPPQEATAEQPWSAADCARLADLLAAAAPNLELARRAARAPDPQVPTPLAPDGDARYLAAGRSVVFLLVASAYRQEGQGDPDGAVAELLLSIRYGDIPTRGGPAIGYMMAASSARDACQAIWCVTSRNPVSAATLRRSAREMLAIAEETEPLIEAIRSDAYMNRVLVDWLYRFGTLDDVGQGRKQRRDPRAWLALRASSLLTGTTRAGLRRDFADFYRHLVAAADLPYPAARKRLDTLLPPTFFGADPKVRNPLGLALARNLMAVVERMFRGAAERDAILRGTALFLAIRAYESETGAPPQSLAELVPDYLPRVPLDPFDGEPFRYRAETIPEHWGDAPWGVYSIGSDLDDNGGKAADCAGMGPRNPDMVWSRNALPPPKPGAAPPAPGSIFGGGRR